MCEEELQPETADFRSAALVSAAECRECYVCRWVLRVPPSVAGFRWVPLQCWRSPPWCFAAVCEFRLKTMKEGG